MGTGIAAFLNTSPVDPTVPFDAFCCSCYGHSFDDEAGLSGSEIATLLDTSTIDPTTSLGASSSFFGNSNCQEAAPSDVATVAFSDPSAIDPIVYSDASDSILEILVDIFCSIM